jgi:hypothetical protein
LAALWQKRIPWTTELKAQITELWKTHSVKQIAEAIGYPEQRNAVMSMLKRMRVPSPRGPKGNQHTIPLKSAPRPRPLPRARPQLRDSAPVARDPGLDKPVPIPFLKLTRETCRWPMWGDRVRLQTVDDATFCGARTLWSGYPWCELHAKQALTPARWKQATPKAQPLPSNIQVGQTLEKSAGPIMRSMREEWSQGPLPEELNAPPAHEQQNLKRP